MYVLGARLTAMWNKKAAKWVEGRKDLLERIESTIDKNADIAWFHCASLGEFEQGRPVLEQFKKDYPNYKILLTFFSPSGYEIRKNYPHADYIFYLPADTQENAIRFVEAVNPKIALFVKYDFWFNFIQTLHDKNIPIVYVSAVFRPDQHFFKPKGKWFLEKLKLVNLFFVQGKDSLRLLNKHGITQVEIVGDTRFDRVIEIASKPQKFPLIEQFKGERKLIIAGSTWAKDNLMMTLLIKKREDEFKYIIVPHEIDAVEIEKLIGKIELNCVLFSQLNEENVKNADVIIVDTIGQLAHLYQYADLAYVGGGFDKGIHNILEPAAFHIPILFGPNFQKFQEAGDLTNVGGAFAVYAFRNINHKINDLFFEESQLEAARGRVATYMQENTGATTKIMERLKEILDTKPVEQATN